MTEKTKIKLDNLISKFPNEHKELFREIAEYAISLGYSPRFNGKESYADFVKSKHGKTIMKISPYPQPNFGKPALNIRFDALPVCSGVFSGAAEYSSIQCKNCSRCNGANGIKYTLPNGEIITGCCQSLRDIPSYGIEDVSEIKYALKIQDDHLMGLVDA